MQEHMKNGLIVAQFLENHPAVERVLHPGILFFLTEPKQTLTNIESFEWIGLKSHPQHELAKKQSYGHSGIFSFYLRGGYAECKIVERTLKIFIPAPSWGGTESLFQYPWVILVNLKIYIVRLKVNVV